MSETQRTPATYTSAGVQEHERRCNGNRARDYTRTTPTAPIGPWTLPGRTLHTSTGEGTEAPRRNREAA